MKKGLRLLLLSVLLLFGLWIIRVKIGSDRAVFYFEDISTNNLFNLVGILRNRIKYNRYLKDYVRIVDDLKEIGRLCKPVSFSTNAEKIEYTRKLLSYVDASVHYDAQLGLLVSDSENLVWYGPLDFESNDTKSNRFAAVCWVVWVGNEDGEGKRAFETRKGDVKVVSTRALPTLPSN